MFLINSHFFLFKDIVHLFNQKFLISHIKTKQNYHLKTKYIHLYINYMYKYVKTTGDIHSNTHIRLIDILSLYQSLQHSIYYIKLKKKIFY